MGKEKKEKITFEDLKEYIEKMSMSHIYQPVMIKELLIRGGKASNEQIGKALLNYDQSQIEYYAQRTNVMVGSVLKNNKVVKKDKKVFSLISFDDFKDDKSKVSQIKKICDEKIKDYIKKRGDEIWAHRNITRRAIKGTDRYEVLKRAKGRCELCGSPEKFRAIEVDHIIPKSLKGKDEISNYQALCFKCNALKGNKDDTDFREIAKSYSNRDKNCLFCNIPKKRIVLKNELCYSIIDKYEVTKHHTLIIPKRHVNDYFELYQPEINSIHQLIIKTQNDLKKLDPSITSFNIGINNGSDAGQTIMHTHIHLIPRRKNDVKNPRGGIRGIIPEKQSY